MFRGLALAARAGLADTLPGRIVIVNAGTGPDSDVAAYLNAALGRDVLVSLRIGPPRANRKPVLQLLAADGGLAGFAKIGVTELTRDLVRAEAAALALLGAARLDHLAVPRLIHHGQWRGHEVLVQAGLSGSGPAANWAQLSAAMAELAGVAGHHQAARRPEPLLAGAATAAGGLPAAGPGRIRAAGPQFAGARRRGHGPVRIVAW